MVTFLILDPVIATGHESTVLNIGKHILGNKDKSIDLTVWQSQTVGKNPHKESAALIETHTT